ncbi:MAG: hypothetical protein Q9222_001541 [Ikaeria aurantiellina]
MSAGDLSYSRKAFSLRVATKDDLDDLARIHRDGFEEEPAVNYCYPFRHKYPEDYWKWTMKEYIGFLEQPHKFLTQVLEVSSTSDGKRVIVIVGFAVWNLAVLTKADNRDIGLKERRDANVKHCEAFEEAAAKRFESYFADYAGKQINLATLVVHPDFRRHGAGTQLVNWGIEAAEEKRWPVTLCASPMGQLLYEYLNFEQIASEVVQVEGEEETLTSTVMRFWNLELKREKICVGIPAGFPNQIESPLVWKGAEIESKQSEWKLDLTHEDIAAIDAALVAFEAKYDDLSSISASTFELPASFSQRLRNLSDQLYKGVGFQIIHGLDPTKYTQKQRIIVYAGVSAHICPQRGFVDVIAKDVVGEQISHAEEDSRVSVG